MAGKGPPPKDPAKRARRNKGSESTTGSAGGFTTVSDQGFDGDVPLDLPRRYRWQVSEQETNEHTGKSFWVRVEKEFTFLAATREWFDHVSRSPQASTYTIWAWHELVFLARLVDQFHRGDPSVVTEMRLRSSKLGATPEDLLRARITVETTPPDGTGTRKAPSSRARTDPRKAHLRAVEG